MSAKKKKKKKEEKPSTKKLEKELGKTKGISVYRGKATLVFKTKRQARRQALIDYVTDLEERTIVDTYHRSDRNYSELVGFTRFQHWATTDGWFEYRKTFWERTQTKLIRRMEDRLVDLHMKDIDLLNKIQRPLLEYLLPFMGEDGNIERTEEGLPKYPLELGRMDNVAKVWLALQDKKTALRGDVLHRTDVIARGHREEEEKEESRQVSGRFSKDEYENIARLAQHVLASRDPRLQRVIDTEGQDGEDGGEEGDS